MAYVVLDSTQTTVKGKFLNPQPGFPGYAEIDDNDPRLIAFINSITQKEQCDQVDTFRDNRLAVGYADSTTGKTFQCDADSRGFWTALGAAAQGAISQSPQPTFDLIASDNSVTTLNASDAYALIQGRMMPWVSATMLYARTMKNNILAGNAPADITQGWP